MLCSVLCALQQRTVQSRHFYLLSNRVKCVQREKPFEGGTSIKIKDNSSMSDTYHTTWGKPFSNEGFINVKKSHRVHSLLCGKAFSLLILTNLPFPGSLRI